MDTSTAQASRASRATTPARTPPFRISHTARSHGLLASSRRLSLFS